MRLIRTLISLSLVALLGYIAIAVPLGKKTLWQHLRAIAATEESQSLVEEVKQRANGVLHREEGEQNPGAPDKILKAQGPPDRLTDKERQLLQRLIHDKLAESQPPASAKE